MQKLVIWGQKIDDNRFYPRITVVNLPENLTRFGERTYEVQDISEIKLPADLVKQAAVFSTL
jgi:hypothetical protein